MCIEKKITYSLLSHKLNNLRKTLKEQIQIGWSLCFCGKAIYFIKVPQKKPHYPSLLEGLIYPWHTIFWTIFCVWYLGVLPFHNFHWQKLKLHMLSTSEKTGPEFTGVLKILFTVIILSFKACFKKLFALNLLSCWFNSYLCTVSKWKVFLLNVPAGSNIWVLCISSSCYWSLFFFILPKTFFIITGFYCHLIKI